MGIDGKYYVVSAPECKVMHFVFFWARLVISKMRCNQQPEEMEQTCRKRHDTWTSCYDILSSI